MAGTRIEVRINGVAVASARFGGATIHETLGPSPNTGRLRLGVAPVEGQTVQILATNESPDRVLFAGEVQTVAQSYDLQARNARYDAALIDPSFYANKRRPFGTFAGISASTVAAALALYAPECTTSGIAAGLPPVTITFDGSEAFMACWYRLAAAIGGVAGISYANVLSLALVDAGEAPDPIDLAHPPYNDPPVSMSWDLSQVRTRIYGKGYTATLQADAQIGDTMLAVSDADVIMFSAAGGSAILGRLAGAAQSDIIGYSGTQVGGAGSFAGPGSAPATAPSTGWNSGTPPGSGIYGYAYTFVTAAGETKPSPIGTITVGTIPTPAAPTVFGVSGSGSNFNYFGGDTVRYRCGYSAADSSSDHGLEQISAASGDQTAVDAGGGSAYAFSVGVTQTASALVKWVHLWRQVNSGSWRVVYTWPANDGNGPIAEGGAGVVNSLPGGTSLVAVLSGIAIGPSGTTQRKVYRTVVDGSQLKLLATIADNTTTTRTADTTADGSLGADAPTSDTSGLVLVSGLVVAGSTSLPVAAVGPFPAAGGWVIVSGHYVRYTSAGSQSLDGIPASGSGALESSVAYGTPIIVASVLTGLTNPGSPATGLAAAYLAKATVALWIQCDDLGAQADLGALESRSHGSPSDGIREDTLFDGRMGLQALSAACNARLASFSRPVVSLQYATGDVKTRCGASVAVSDLGYDSLADVAKLAYWRLEETSGVTLADTTGNGHTATIQTGTSGYGYRVPGALLDDSRGLSLSGAINRANVADISLGTTFSLEAWITLTDVGALSYGVIAVQTTGDGLYVQKVAGLYYLDFFSAGDHRSTVPLRVGALSHCVVSVSGGTGQLFVNGAASGPTFAVGAFTLQRLFNAEFDGAADYLSAALIDEVAVYSVGLTPAQVAARHFIARNVVPFPAGTFTIQDVVKTFIGRADGPIVKHTVTASSVAFTLRDVLRLAQLIVP